ncbi:MAG: hypothetical protein N2F24_03810 [Deltaproteobacteria bacterium]
MRTQEKRRRRITAIGVIGLVVLMVGVLIKAVQPGESGEETREIVLPGPLTSSGGGEGKGWGPIGAMVLIEEFSDFQ